MLKCITPHNANCIISTIIHQISTIFKTIDDETSLSGQKIVSVLQARKIAQEQAIKQTNLDIQCLKNYEAACKNGTVTSEDFTMIMGKASSQAQDYSKNIKDGTGSAQVYADKQKTLQQSIKNTGTASQVAAIGVKALSIAGNMLAGMAISFAISKVIEGIEYLATASERAIEKTKELQEEISQISSDYQSERQTLEGLREEYDSLTAKIGENGAEASLSADEYERYRDITSEILGITPKLITGWDDEGRAISNKNGLLQQSIDLLDEEYQKSLRNSTTKSKNEEIAAGIIESKNNFDNSVDTKTKSGTMADMRESFLNELEKLETQSGMTEHDIVEKMWVYFDPNANPNNFWSNHVDTYEELRNLISSDYDKLGNSFIDENNPIYELFSDEVIDEMIQKADEYFQELARIESEEQQYYQQYKDQLNLNAQAVGDAYNSLSDETKAEITQMIDSFDYSNMTKDKFSDMAIDLKDFVGKLSTDGTLLSYFDNLFKPMGEDESIEDYEKRVKTGIDNITSYCETNYPAIKLSFGDIERDVEDLKAKYNATIERFTGESNDADLEKFFEDNSINDESEIDYFNKVTEGAKTASEAIEMYNKVKSDTFNNEIIYSENFKSINDSLNTLTENASLLSSINKEISETGRISADNLSKINEAFPEDKYPEMTKALYKYQLGLISTTELFEELEKCYDSDTKSYVKLLNEKLQKDEEFTKIFAENYSELYTEITNVLYKGDLESWKTLEKTKLDIDNQITNGLKKNWADYIGIIYDAASDMYKLTYRSSYSSTPVDIDKMDDSDIASQYATEEEYQQAMGKINPEAQKELERINQLYELKKKLEEASLSSTELKIGDLSWDDLSSDSSKSSKTVFDWIETKVANLNDEIDKLNDKTSDVYSSWISRNNALTSAIEKTKEAIELQKQAYDRYMQEANSVGLSDTWKNLVQNGAIDIDTISDSDLKEKIQSYQDWYEKAQDCIKSQQDLEKSLKELNSQNFDDIKSEYESLTDLLSQQSDLIQSQIDLLELKGRFANEKYYQDMISLSQKELDELTKEREQLNAVLNSSSIDKNSEKWIEMYSALLEVDGQIQDITNNIQELNNNIRDLNWEIFDYLEESIGRITDETSFWLGLLDNEKLFDDEGVRTKYGDAAIGLHSASYEAYMKQAQDYYSEMKHLQEELSNGAGKDVLERYRELVDAHQDAITAANDEKKAILDLVKEGYEP